MRFAFQLNGINISSAENIPLNIPTHWKVRRCFSMPNGVLMSDIAHEFIRLNSIQPRKNEIHEHNE